MLGYTRQIERALVVAEAAGPLYVGFQTVTKVPGETARYRRLRQEGVNVRGFGEGAIDSADRYGLRGRTALTPDHERLENQWFLVSLAPEPIAFVGWEISAEDRWGRDGITAPGKCFAGFITDVGFAHPGKRCAALSIGTVVDPAGFTRPSLLRRLQGYTLEKLRAHAAVTLVVDDPEGGAWYVPAAAVAVRRDLALSR